MSFSTAEARGLVSSEPIGSRELHSARIGERGIDDTGFVSHHDAEQALQSSGDYLNVIRADIAARKP
jgi:hypothetical protein